MSIPKIESVLYVDDDPDICAVVNATLSLIAGFKVHIAGSGEQAVDLAYMLRPDLVLMDVTMPGLDGPSTLKRMREHALLADIPVIFLTARVLPAEVARLHNVGAIGVIGKPFDPLKLCEDVVAIWKRVHASRGIDDRHAAQSQVRAQIRALTDGFLDRTRSDVARMQATIERAGGEDRSVLKEVQRAAHSIHGAGGMFGFPEISAAAGVIERLVERIMAGTARNSPGEAEMLQQLSDCAAQLAHEIEAAGPPTGSCLDPPPAYTPGMRHGARS
jgi:two-component system, OmpR family, response regulator